VTAARSLRKRSIAIAGHATSISLEDEFWSALQDIARRRGMALGRLIAQTDERRTGNLSSALRLLVLEAYRQGEMKEAVERD
jgi:predicted DNA-binding ribbon-helix-helix protein